MEYHSNECTLTIMVDTYWSIPKSFNLLRSRKQRALSRSRSQNWAIKLRIVFVKAATLSPSYVVVTLSLPLEPCGAASTIE